MSPRNACALDLPFDCTLMTVIASLLVIAVGVRRRCSSPWYPLDAIKTDRGVPRPFSGGVKEELLESVVIGVKGGEPGDGKMIVPLACGFFTFFNRRGIPALPICSSVRG